jgi:hypothetical protein
VVDSFLMTTPIYFAFWILVGTVQKSGTERNSPSV